MSIFGLPLILFKLPSGAVADDEMSDFQYLAIKKFLDKLKRVSTITTTSTDTTVLATLTASGAHDLYLAKANITFNTQAGGSEIQIDLKANGVVIDSYVVRLSSTSELDADHDFTISGEKVTTGQTFTVVATLIGGVSTKFNATILGWEEDTGASPQEPPLEPV